MLNYSFKRAFTLAEVLITLGIIAIVAALTIPNLISNYKKKVLESGLVRFYSTINQAIKLSEIENGERRFWKDYGYDSCGFYEQYLAPYLKTTDYECGYYNPANNKHVDSNLAVGIYFQSGDMAVFSYGRYFYYIYNTKKYYKNYPVMGSGNPEDIAISDEYGKNIFVFVLHLYNFNSGVVPYGMQYNDTATDEQLMEKCAGNRHLTCSALIAKNNWKIPEDYPFDF